MPDFGPIPESTSGAGNTPAVGGALGAGVGKMFGEIDKAKEQSGALLDAAKGNGFRVSENAAKPLREALARAQSKFLVLQGDANNLSQLPLLGTGPYAQQVAHHVQRSNDGPQGVLTMLQELQAVLQQSDEALGRAMENYQRAEADQKSTFNS